MRAARIAALAGLLFDVAACAAGSSPADDAAVIDATAVDASAIDAAVTVGTVDVNGAIDAAPFETAPSATVAACQACQLASAAPNCVPTLLTATTRPDLSTGDAIAVGWGLDTLASADARDAAAALLRCLNQNACARNSTNTAPGSNPVLGCFCGAGVTPEDCIGGAGVHGPCLDQYRAAAVVSAGGPAATASLASASLFITMAAFDPSGPIGLADTIKQCAIDAPCPVCDGL